jgi:excisionase family DNA binding protein
MKKLTVTIEEAATALGIGRNSAYAAARTGEIHTIKVGKRVLVPISSLQQMLNGTERSNAILLEPKRQKQQP